eukprot:TRINITY_DN11445_c0_g1_i1.p1 TRINITY_DN11445_c0_g1~~TRINITY_DN11445_c0_g1_i1.p1  ORF type:complete len:418 (-),score=99.69 TRINITY_DN11445_c0_g1_i1:7-1224(-)
MEEKSQKANIQQETSKQIKKSNDSSVIPIVVSVLVILIGIGAAFFLWEFDDPQLLGLDIPDMISWDQLSQLEKDRWNDSVPFSFPGAEPVPVIEFDRFSSDFIEDIITAEKVVVIKGGTKFWPAFRNWYNPDYLKENMPTVVVHVPTNPVVRMHQMDSFQAFSQLDQLNWTRPWNEKEVYFKTFQEGKKAMYFMMNMKYATPSMRGDVIYSTFSVPYAPPMEVNLWMGTPRVTTPAHYDMVHNFYAQIAGKKRFILFDASEADKLYTFPALHPSARQSQINFNDPSCYSKYPNFKNIKVQEVILSPGDALYLPPFHFHYVSVVGNTTSISISTHTESQAAKVREFILNSGGKFFDYFGFVKMPLPTRIALFQEYILGLFSSKEEALNELQIILAVSYTHLTLPTT